MKKMFLILLISFILISCNEVNSTKREAALQEELSVQSIEAVGLPSIVNFYEKKTLKRILEMRDNPQIVNYLYTRNAYTGKWIYEGKVIGFGIPYSTQYTNPEKKVYGGSSSGNIALPQADPNGLYSVPNGTATWVIKVNDTGEQSIEYIESEIRVTQKKLNINLVEAWSITKDY